MTRRSLSVRALADEADTSVDEVLVTLWDLGVSTVLSPQDIIGHRDLKRARRALGVATRAELRTLRYWSNLLAVSEEHVRALLGEHGVSMGVNATSRAPAKANANVGRVQAADTSRVSLDWWLSTFGNGFHIRASLILASFIRRPGSSRMDTSDSRRK